MFSYFIPMSVPEAVALLSRGRGYIQRPRDRTKHVPLDLCPNLEGAWGVGRQRQRENASSMAQPHLAILANL